MGKMGAFGKVPGNNRQQRDAGACGFELDVTRQETRANSVGWDNGDIWDI